MPKRKCNFTNDSKRNYPFLKETVDSKVLCNYCQSVFSINHGGRSDIKDYLGGSNVVISCDKLLQSCLF